jgi:hypothetical protein
MDTKKKTLYLIHPKQVVIFWTIPSDEYWELQEAYEWLYDNGMVTIIRDEDLKFFKLLIH